VPYFGARSREIRQEAGFVQQDVIDYRRGNTASLCIGRVVNAADHSVTCKASGATEN